MKYSKDKENKLYNLKCLCKSVYAHSHKCLSWLAAQRCLRSTITVIQDSQLFVRSILKIYTIIKRASPCGRLGDHDNLWRLCGAHGHIKAPYVLYGDLMFRQMLYYRDIFPKSIAKFMEVPYGSREPMAMALQCAMRWAQCTRHMHELSLLFLVKGIGPDGGVQCFEFVVNVLLIDN